ncbi:LLM class flavin-dependent oxidoreductase [Streptomyces europaeiscabiei]|uniref:LLM class flavin-dependent oxidoreductase n=1 Tax=Streptomyces europaeiscabiei TaxID=146819 RepID=A0AAJ2PN69_9ACTN|nr:MULTISPECIES: LLM class flavin-dependent oxidoreductase [Streptomyces]KFF97865.1 monooxygenase [Streptomyces scabiei]MDX3130283.1 LLM class flavin-dependent oxidoreductase [Streptomyces europaeiscabiei]
MKLSVLDQSIVPEGSTPATALHNSLDLARLADGLGYHRYWLAEHHATPSFAGPAPEIMVARVAAETRRIRVGSGGVLLPHYSPLKVAEVFRVLGALSPGRIDLGIGRGTGAGSIEAHALAPGSSSGGDDENFPGKLAELLAFLHGGFPEAHPYGRIQLMPTAGAPAVWLLVASPQSAELAARLGLPVSIAHFGRPQVTRSVVEAYRGAFDGRDGSRPRVQIGIAVYCGPTEEEAQRVFASQRLFRLRMGRGLLLPLPSPEAALDGLRGEMEPLADEVAEWPRCVVGDPDHVHKVLTSMAEELGIDEFMVLSTIHAPQDRMRSYELLARRFGLTSQEGDEINA